MDGFSNGCGRKNKQLSNGFSECPYCRKWFKSKRMAEHIRKNHPCKSSSIQMERQNVPQIKQNHLKESQQNQTNNTPSIEPSFTDDKLLNTMDPSKMNETPWIDPLAAPLTNRIPTPTVDHEGYNCFTQPSTTTPNWRTRFQDDPKDRLRYLFENDEDTDKDVVFIVGPTNVEIRAHKLILTSASVGFKHLLDNSGATVFLKDQDPKAIEFLIRYSYLGELAPLDQCILSNLIQISSAAEEYQFPHVHSKCIRRILDKIKSDWKCALELFECKDLSSEIHDTCINAIGSNIEDVVTSLEFLNLSKPSLRAIIGSDKLAIKEIKVLDAAICWAQHQINQQGPESRMDVKSVLGDAIHDIRFPLFTVEEYMRSVTLHEILDGEDHLKISKYITRKMYKLGNPEDPLWDPWPFRKEPRATSSPQQIPAMNLNEHYYNDGVISAAQVIQTEEINAKELGKRKIEIPTNSQSSGKRSKQSTADKNKNCFYYPIKQEVTTEDDDNCDFDV